MVDERTGIRHFSPLLSVNNSVVIAGFNTDIEFDGTVYHVQTEDKGLQKRMIMSLVYDKGAILASKRVSYADLAAANFDEKVLADRVGRQHSLICAAVRAGRIDELKDMTAKSAATVAKATASPSIRLPQEAVIAAPPVPAARIETVPSRRPLNIAIVETERVISVTPPNPFVDEPVIDAVHIIEDEHILPAEAVEVVSELSGQERPANNKLCLELLGDAQFKGGDRRTVNIMICRGTGRRVVGDAQIMIKVLGSSFRPVIFHAKSDANGLAKVHLQLPHFQAGRAALLVRAMSTGEEIELRRVVTPG